MFYSICMKNVKKWLLVNTGPIIRALSNDLTNKKKNQTKEKPYQNSGDVWGRLKQGSDMNFLTIWSYFLRVWELA